MNAEQLLEQAQADRESIVADRRSIHRQPGTGFDIAPTVAYVKARLEEMGYTPAPCGKAGLVALAGGQNPGKVFLVRADMDALPIEEQSGVEFCSEVPGKMHACGHDMHTAMLLEAARLLKAHESEIRGTVKLMFQPAEEIFLGADDMIRAGVLENPHVDAALMIHVAAAMPLPAGTVVACDAGVSATACDFYDVTVQGKGCHGSMPQLGIDPIVAASNMISALQEINAREIGMKDEAVLTVGYVNAGNANNVIPDSARFGGSIRTFDEELRAQIKQRVDEMIPALGRVYRTTATVEWSSGCPCLDNDAALAACVPGYLRELLGPQGAFTMSQLAAMAGGRRQSSIGGSEDFAFVSQEVPSLMLALAAGTPQEGYAYPQHHPMVRFDERVLPTGAAVYAYIAMRWLEEHSL